MDHVHAALATALAAYPPFVASIVSNAAGTAPGIPPFTGVDVLGFYLSRGTTVVECWMVTPGRLVRAEITDSAALVITFPIERVTRVMEAYTTEGYVLTLELQAEAMIQISDNRQAFTTYALRPADEPGLAELQEFSRQVRLAVGI